MSSELPKSLDIGVLLRCCVVAASQGVRVIREVQAAREGSGDDTGLDVRYKDVSDPRSALTVADVAAQKAVMRVLRGQFPHVTVVGEEDEDKDEAGNNIETSALAANDSDCGDVWIDAALDTPIALKEVPTADVTVFVDPVDGTNEFVCGRLDAVQTLVGIAVKGRAVAGAVGLPFPRDGGDPVVMYGMVGAGVVALPAVSHEDRAKRLASDVGRKGALLTSSVKPKHPVIRDAQAVIAAADILPVGGAGNKMLQVASGAADAALLNLVTSLWDTCATEAILSSLGGKVTDLFGNRIRHAADARICNCYGVIATSATFSQRDSRRRSHDDVCRELRESGVLDSLLSNVGLIPTEPGQKQAMDIARDVRGEPLSAEWLSTILAFPVKSYSAPETTAVRYLMSDACRIQLVPDMDKCDEAARAAAAKCPSVFLKRVVMSDLPHVQLKAKTAPEKLARDVRSYQVEASFLASRACARFVESGARVAQTYHADLQPDASGKSPIDSKFLLVLEDFRPQDGWMQRGLLEEEGMCGCLASLADLHAFFWAFEGDVDYKELSDAVWPVATYWSPGKQSPDLMDKVETCWQKHRGSFANELVASNTEAAGKVTLDNLGTILQTRVSEFHVDAHRTGADKQSGHRTIIHGDCKAANFFFNEKTGEVGMIDFQWCGFGNPATDVAYIMASSASANALKREEQLLDYYHSCLTTALVRFNKAPNMSAAAELYPKEALRTAYELALLDLFSLIVTYHWARIEASPSVLASRAHQLGSNSYNKNTDCAIWLIYRALGLLNARAEAEAAAVKG